MAVQEDFRLNIDNPYLRGTIWDYSPEPELIDREPLVVPETEDDLYYTIEEGDTLTYIANKPFIYGNYKLWWLIFDNNDLDNPWDLTPGDVLRIPPKSALNFNI